LQPADQEDGRNRVRPGCAGRQDAAGTPGVERQRDRGGDGGRLAHGSGSRPGQAAADAPRLDGELHEGGFEGLAERLRGGSISMLTGRRRQSRPGSGRGRAGRGWRDGRADQGRQAEDRRNLRGCALLERRRLSAAAEVRSSLGFGGPTDPAEGRSGFRAGFAGPVKEGDCRRGSRPEGRRRSPVHGCFAHRAERDDGANAVAAAYLFGPPSGADMFTAFPPIFISVTASSRTSRTTFSPVRLRAPRPPGVPGPASGPDGRVLAIGAIEERGQGAPRRDAFWMLGIKRTATFNSLAQFIQEMN